MPKKILLATRPLVPPWDEASKNFAYFLARNIRDESMEIHILTTEEKLEGLSANIIAHPLYSAPKKNRHSHFSLSQKIRLPLYLALQNILRYDVVHYLYTPTFSNTLIIRALRCFTIFRPKTLQTVATLRTDLYTDKKLHSLLFADRLITYTELTKRKLEQLGFENVTRIYPGIDLDRYQPQPKDKAVMNTYGLSPADFFVIYPGEYTRLGATDMLAEAFLTYFSAHPDSTMKFLFACRIKNEADHAKREQLRQAVKQAGLESKVLFVENPAATDMPALYNTADVVIFPVGDLQGKFDVPLVIIEAYACGKPVILSDLPSFAEFSNSNICVTIPKGSGLHLIESLSYLKQNPDVRARLGENARRFTKDHFDLKNTAKQYEEIYASL